MIFIYYIYLNLIATYYFCYLHIY